MLNLYHQDYSKGPVKARANIKLRSGEKLIKEPIPFNWVCRAAQLSSKPLNIALAIWFLAGFNKSSTVKLSQSVLNEMSVVRHSKARALTNASECQADFNRRCTGLLSSDHDFSYSPI